MNLSKLAVTSLTLLVAACNTLPPAADSSNPTIERLPSTTRDAEIEAHSSNSSDTNSTEVVNAPENQSKKGCLDSSRKLIGQNKGAEAISHLDACEKQWGADNSTRLLRADAFRKMRQYSQAEALYMPLTDKTPQAALAWYGLGKVSIDKGNLTQAATRLENALEADPKNIDTYIDLGLVYLLDGKKEQSLKTFTRARELSNNNPNVLSKLALWGLVFDDPQMSAQMADQLKWSPKTRNRILLQANSIKKRLRAKAPVAE